MENPSEHSASDAALGFMYQGLYALLALWREVDDDAAVLIETLDDVVLLSNGETLLQQLKHSLSAKSPSLTIKSVSLWKTLKAWIDILPELSISQTRFNLVSVADVSKGSVLEALLGDVKDRSELLAALKDEAKRVLDEREEAKVAGENKLPHASRAAGCKAFLTLPEDTKIKLIAQIRLKPSQASIVNIEKELERNQLSVTPEKRAEVTQRLVEWWNRQVIFSMCGKRNKAITRFELVQRHMEIVSDIELDKLSNPFETQKPPSSYQPDNMIERQIALVGGSEGELNRAIREEWRARETRSIWSSENPARHELIAKYDDRLAEEWSDRHVAICESYDSTIEIEQRQSGHNLLIWSHVDAPKDLEPIAPTVVAPYYVRGSYQVLSITGRVGWHPNYRALLGFEE